MRTAFTIRLPALPRHIAAVPANGQTDNQGKKGESHSHSPWSGRLLFARSQPTLLTAAIRDHAKIAQAQRNKDRDEAEARFQSPPQGRRLFARSRSAFRPL